MKIDFSKILEDLDGIPFPFERHQGQQIIKGSLTLGEYARRSLNQKPGDKPLTVEENGKRYELIKKVMDKKQPQELEAEEVAVIRESARWVNWSTEIDGAANQFLK